MCEQQRVQNLSREAPKCCAWQHQGGGPETRSGTVQSLKCCPCQQKRAARLPSAAPGSIKEGGGPNQVLRLAASREGGGPETRSGSQLGYRPEPEVLPLPAETSREAPKCCAWQHQGGGGGQTKCCAWQHQGRGGAPKRARVPSRSAACQQKPARLPSPASRNEPRGSQVLRAETRSGTVQSLKCCPCQQKRAARLPSAAPSMKKTRSGTVQCCPCQQKRAARLPSAAPGRAPKRARAPSRAARLPSAAPDSIKGRPETRSGTVQSLKCCPCQQKLKRGGARNALGHRPRLESAAPGSIEGGGPRNALGHRQAPKCCVAASRGEGPETRSGTVQSQQKRAARLQSAAPGSIERGGPRNALKCCPCQQKRAARLESAAPGSIEGGPETCSGTVQSLKCCPCQQKRAARLESAAPGSIEGAGTVQSLKCCPCQQKRAARLERGSKVLRLQHRGGGAPKRARAPSRA